jgi:hypothetical protein
MSDPALLLAQSIDTAVAVYGFRQFKPDAALPPLPWIAAWKRKTWNTNRGIALLAMPDQATHAGEVALDLRVRAGKAIGYLPFLYELGLQLILVGPIILKKGEGLERYVTKVNNSTVILQSIHLVDPVANASFSVRTWGQVVTCRFIDAIETGITRFFESEKEARN